MTSPIIKTINPPKQSLDITNKLSNKVRSKETQKVSSPPKQTTTIHYREKGYIEKLLNSYGFIQSTERNARFFFHFSQYHSNVVTMNVGVNVEFEESSDERSGKPLAVNVVRVDPSTRVRVDSGGCLHGSQSHSSTVMVSPNRIPGIILKEAKETVGSVSYESNGEHFFLMYESDGVESGNSLKEGDVVTFVMGTTASGVTCASDIRPAVGSLERFCGVVSSMKDSFGFIERADIVREIFFHYSEYELLDSDGSGLQLGDDVEFSIQSRNGKEVAVQVTKLKRGSVVFEDIGTETRRGKIQRVLKTSQGKPSSDPLGGRIVYETVSGPIEIPYGDRDQKLDHMLLLGDIVQFNIATDRRDKLQHATNILLAEDSFYANGEVRERGEIVTLKDGYGFIRCWDRVARIFFHFSEFLDNVTIPRLNDVLEFTVIPDPNAPNKPLAIRLKRLPAGEFVRPPAEISGSPSKSTISNHDSSSGDNTSRRTEASDVATARSSGSGDRNGRRNSVDRSDRNSVSVLQGYVAALKDKFGFIETADHQHEVFFHFSNFMGNAPSELKLGDEVEFTLSRRTTRPSADNVFKLPKGTIESEEVQPTLYTGKVVQGLRVNNNDEQNKYSGIIVLRGQEDDPSAPRYHFGITSLADAKDTIQVGDNVLFQLTVSRTDDRKRATNVTVIRKPVISTVETLKGEYGFLTYEAEVGRKLFFHVSDIIGDEPLHVGDDVEFVVVKQKDGKYVAKLLRKISSNSMDSPRPDRLISKLKAVDSDVTRVTVLRQPKGPDGSRGFTLSRTAEANQR